MFVTLIVALALAGQTKQVVRPHRLEVGLGKLDLVRSADVEAGFPQAPITLHRYVPLELLDLEIRRQHLVIQEKQVLLDAARQLARQGKISPSELDRAIVEFRFHKAKESERSAYRALEVHERDVSSGVIAADEVKEYAFLMDWLKYRRAMAEAKADILASWLAHDRHLHERGAIGYWDWVESRLAYDEARAEVTLSQAQQDWAVLAQAAKAGPGSTAPERRLGCKAALRQASLRFSEAMVARDNLLLDIIRVVLRSRLELKTVTPQSVVLMLKLAYEDALASLAASRRRLVEFDVEKADPENYAPALRRSIEIDDIDRAIRRHHYKALLGKALVDIDRQLAHRVALCPDAMEYTLAHSRFLEALELERLACRALIAYDRDACGWAIQPDGVREYTLALDWIKRMETMEEIRVEYLTSRLGRDRALFRRNAMSRGLWAMSCYEYHEAVARLALHQTEDARFSWKLAALTGQTVPDPTSLLRLLTAALRASVRRLEATAVSSQCRLAIEEETFREGFTTPVELKRCQGGRDISNQALAIARKRLAALEAEGEHNEEFIRELEELARFFLLRWDHKRAKLLYERALTLRKNGPGENHPAYATTLASLAEVSVAMGDFVSAESLFCQAAAINKRTLGEEHPFYAESLSALATLCCAMGDRAQAEALMLQDLKIVEKVYGNKHPIYARSLNSLVLLYSASGDYARAERHAQRAVETLEKAVGETHPYFAMGLNRLAWVHVLRGNFDLAEPLVRRALQIQEQVLGKVHLSYGESLRTLGHVHQGKGDAVLAASLYHQALEIKEQVLGKTHPDCSSELRDLASLYYAMGDCSRARLFVLQALKIDRQSLELASSAQSERQQLLLIAKLRSGLDLYLSLGQQAHSECAEVYREVLAWKGTVFARQQKVRMARTWPDSDPEVAKLFAELDQTTSRLAWLVFSTESIPIDPTWRSQIQGLTEEKERLERELSRRSFAFSSQQRLWQLTPAELQAALPPAAALVDILVYNHFEPPPQGNGNMRGERRVMAFVVRPGRPVMRFDLGSEALIATTVARWRAALVDDRAVQGAGSSDPAIELHRLVWQPLERSLQGVQAVLVSPDGALARFPLAALPGQRPGSFLIEDLPIALVPVPQLLPQFQPQGGAAMQVRRSPASLLIVGDIDFGALPGPSSPTGHGMAVHLATRGGRLLQFPSLPGTAQELKEVRATFEQAHPDGVVDVVRGTAATETAFRSQAPGKRYLHLATHGFFAPSELRAALNRPAVMLDSAVGPPSARGPANRFGDPHSFIGFHPGLLSGLALAGANRTSDQAVDVLQFDDGILTALEVAGMDLGSTELVVLSACESGLGRAAGGEGLLGLQRAFQVAGARTVVASLWKVDDEATRQLMSDFYVNLWKKRLSPAEALRQAQLHMLNGDSITGQRRGVGDPEPAPVAARRGRIHPRLWAAWVISGVSGMCRPDSGDGAFPGG